MGLFLQKIIAGGSLAFMLYLVLMCPCKRLLCCHLGSFYIALALLMAVVLSENGFKVVDPSC